MARLGLLGDTHTNREWLKYAIDKFSRENCSIVLQLGDFGLWPGADDFWKTAQADLGARGMTLLVTPGNHDDYDHIETLEAQEDGWLFLTDNIKIAPRGLRFEIDGCSFVSVSGAPSVDRDARLSNMERGAQKQWWKQEAVTDADVEAVVADGYADVLLAHDAPAGVATIEKMIGHNPLGRKPEDLIYASKGRDRMTTIMKGVKPLLWFHGHYHFPVDEYVENADRPAFSPDEPSLTRVMGLSRDKANFSLGSLDTETRRAEHWDLEYDYNVYRYGIIRADYIQDNDKRDPEKRGKYL